jgi:diaminobutyrate-2-oxoglutarate transaminase
MVKRRSSVLSFTDGYHGLTMGALAVTGNYFYRDESYGARNNAAFMPYDGYFGPEVNTIDYMRRFLEDGSSGVDLPAAVIVETVQGEGGINVASVEWLKQLESLCREFDILLIIDDIQVGNGRTGTFFSFERAGIHPDMVTVSKSIGGGLPLAMLLMRPELDQWQPGEHTGTFRGNNLAFVAAAEAFRYWDNDDLAQAVHYKGEIIQTELQRMCEKFPELEASVRGLGMVWGLDLPQPGVASEASQEAFQRGLVIETAGANDHVLKFLPPLTIEEELLREGLDIVEQALAALMEKRQQTLVGTEVMGG